MVTQRGIISNRLIIGTILVALALVALWLIVPEITLVGLLVFALASELLLYAGLYLVARRHW